MDLLASGKWFCGWSVAVSNGSDHSSQYDALNPQIRGHRNQSSGFSAHDEWVDPLATANGSVGGAAPARAECWDPVATARGL